MSPTIPKAKKSAKSKAPNHTSGNLNLKSSVVASISLENGIQRKVSQLKHNENKYVFRGNKQPKTVPYVDMSDIEEVHRHSADYLDILSLRNCCARGTCDNHIVSHFTNAVGAIDWNGAMDWVRRHREITLKKKQSGALQIFGFRI